MALGDHVGDNSFEARSVVALRTSILHVLKVSSNAQISASVVEAVAIFVIYLFGALEFSAKYARKDDAMHMQRRSVFASTYLTLRGIFITVAWLGCIPIKGGKISIFEIDSGNLPLRQRYCDILFIRHSVHLCLVSRLFLAVRDVCRYVNCISQKGSLQWTSVR